MIPAVHLSGSGKRGSTEGRAFPLVEQNMPTKQPALAIEAWLNVEKSARYQPTPTQTYCNIYAHDFCMRAGVYLPRVWWSDAALAKFAAGEDVPVKYADTVYELNANALYDWLVKFGKDFGWQPVGNAGEAQHAADAGRIVVIAAAQRNPKHSGHISMVVPQSEKVKYTDGVPVQSQAGRKNFRSSLGTGKRWWEAKSYRGFGMWSNKAK